MSKHLDIEIKVLKRIAELSGGNVYERDGTVMFDTPTINKEGEYFEISCVRKVRHPKGWLEVTIRGEFKSGKSALAAVIKQRLTGFTDVHVNDLGGSEVVDMLLGDPQELDRRIQNIKFVNITVKQVSR